MCDNDMRRFLKEKGNLSLGEMLEKAQNFLDAMNQMRESGFRPRRIRVQIYRFKLEKFNRGMLRSRIEIKTNIESRESSEIKIRSRVTGSSVITREKEENKKVGCFRCGSRSHRISQCDKKDKPDREYTQHGPV